MPTRALSPPPRPPPLTFYLIHSGLILILNFHYIFYFLCEDVMVQFIWWPWWSKHKEMIEDTFELKKTGRDLRKDNTKKQKRLCSRMLTCKTFTVCTIKVNIVRSGRRVCVYCCLSPDCRQWGHCSLHSERGRLLPVSNNFMCVIHYRHAVSVKTRGGDIFHLVESTHTHTQHFVVMSSGCIDGRTWKLSAQIRVQPISGLEVKHWYILSCESVTIKMNYFFVSGVSCVL